MGRASTLDAQQQAAALTLYRTGDWSQSSISETLGVSRSAVQRVLAGTYQPPELVHPSDAGYHRGCRCPGCTSCHAVAQAQYRTKLVT